MIPAGCSGEGVTEWMNQLFRCHTCCHTNNNKDTNTVKHCVYPSRHETFSLHGTTLSPDVWGRLNRVLDKSLVHHRTEEPITPTVNSELIIRASTDPTVRSKGQGLLIFAVTNVINLSGVFIDLKPNKKQLYQTPSRWTERPALTDR